MNALFSPFELGSLTLPNRIVLSPMNRGRVEHHGSPGGLMATYLAQRAEAGLLISESTPVLPNGQGNTGMPGIFDDRQVEGWRGVAKAVHQANGRLFMQLWHAGRVSTSAWQPDSGPPLGPSAIRAAGARMRQPDWTPCEPDHPREASLAEIREFIEGYGAAARRARMAGVDGVEIHACNGYLLQQFMSQRSNQRRDQYGGSAANRIRFTVEVVEAVVSAIGTERLGVRISPLSSHQGAPVDDAQELYLLLIAELDRLGIAYIHCVEGEPGGATLNDAGDLSRFDFAGARKVFGGAWIANNFYNAQRAAAAVKSGHADLVSFGRPFIANPDLVTRLRSGADLNKMNPATVYVPGPAGYTDYPTLEGLRKNAASD